jgi:pyrroloquinoline-quinone synthase
MTRAPNVTAAADAILERVGLMRNPYLLALADGSMSLESFRRSQQQFFFAVRFFARPMAALVSRIPEPATRLDLIHNIVEEHGDFHEAQFHQNTFAKFLSSIGTTRPDPDQLRPAVHAFNSVLIGACANDEVDIGICCLGIIEQAFAEISAVIGKTVVQRGWVPADKLVHYALHAELDVRHAEEFFILVEPHWNEPSRRTMTQQGLGLGAYAFDQLYRNLYIDAGV